MSKKDTLRDITALQHEIDMLREELDASIEQTHWRINLLFSLREQDIAEWDNT